METASVTTEREPNKLVSHLGHLNVWKKPRVRHQAGDFELQQWVLKMQVEIPSSGSTTN